MMPNYLQSLVIFSVCLTQAVSADQFEDLLSLSFKDLVNVEISVASFRSENLNKTPGIVSAFSPSQLSAFGIRDTRELLDFVPGFLLENGVLGPPIPVMRGSAESSGRNILMMIDGVPVWSSHTGLPPLLSVPFSAIDRVEIIRGPGAVIYGTNAIAGVLNFITKKQAGGKALMRFEGDYQSGGSGFYNRIFADGTYLSVGLEQQHDTGFDGNIQDDFGTFADAQYYNQLSSFIFNLGNEKFHLKAHQSENQDNGLFPGVNDFSNQGNFVTRNRLLSTDYRLTEKNYSLDAYADYNSIYFESRFPFFQEVVVPDGGNSTHRIRLGIKGSYSFHDKFHLLAGIENEQRRMGEVLVTQYVPELITFPSQAKDKTHENSLFTQIDYTKSSWRFLLGARYIDNEKAGTSITPRATVVYSLTENNSIKFIYGRGFSSPAFNNTSIDIDPLIIGNQSLEAETIDSYDIAYTHVGKNALFVFNLFKFVGDKFIIVGAAPSETGRVFTFVNSDEFSHQGAELDFQRQYTHWKVFANASYLQEGDGDIEDSNFATITPKLMGNLGVAFEGSRHTIGGKMKYISKRSTLESALSVDVNYSYRLNDIEFFITLNNILGEDQRSGDYSSFTTTTFQREPEDMYLQVGIETAF